MALTLADFREEYPEFDRASDALVQKLLDRAEERTPPDIWGELEDQGHGLLAAHLLTLRPEAKEMRLESGKSTYQEERELLARTVASGFRVTG